MHLYLHIANSSEIMTVIFGDHFIMFPGDNLCIQCWKMQGAIGSDVE